MARMVKKTSVYERFIHWLLALSGLVLLFTGLGFLYQQELGWIDTVFGGQHIAKGIHNWSGLVFTAALLLSLGVWLSEALNFTKEDREWIGMLGGYFSKGAVAPPQGKLNAGQKLVVLVVVVFGFVAAVSGFYMWLNPGHKGAMMLGIFFHNISSLVFAFFIPIHIYLATAANPGTFRIMTKGDVPLYWAKKKHARWVKEMGLD
jgi:formate dehydrogenase subunit gamma